MKRLSDLDKLDDDDENVFQKSIIDRYQHRPSLESICLAEFAATYVVVYQDEDASDALPPPDESSILGSGRIKLNAGMGYMSKRRQAVIRFRKYNQELQPSDYFRANFHGETRKLTCLVGIHHIKHTTRLSIVQSLKMSKGTIK